MVCPPSNAGEAIAKGGLPEQPTRQGSNAVLGLSNLCVFNGQNSIDEMMRQLDQTLASKE
jgi:hypothetical protein